jgi:hypothetical protein
VARLGHRERPATAQVGALPGGSGGTEPGGYVGHTLVPIHPEAVDVMHDEVCRGTTVLTSVVSADEGERSRPKPSTLPEPPMNQSGQTPHGPTSPEVASVSCRDPSAAAAVLTSPPPSVADPEARSGNSYPDR